MSCSVIDRRSNDSNSNSGCRLRGSSASLAASTGGGVKTSSGQGGSVASPGLTNSNATNMANAAIQLRPNKQCCLCWCCCCSCSCLMRGVDDNGPTKNPNNKDLLNCDGEPPPTIEEIRSWGKSFDKLMRSTAGRMVFRDFLRCEYSEENILFWLACEELKREANPDVVEEKARFIYEDYISILSPKEVSLDSRVREIVNRNMMEPTPHTFDEAQLQIYTLMHRDSYPRFVNSPLYKKLAQVNNGNGGSGGGGAGVGSASGSGPGGGVIVTTPTTNTATCESELSDVKLPDLDQKCNEDMQTPSPSPHHAETLVNLTTTLLTTSDTNQITLMTTPATPGASPTLASTTSTPCADPNA